MPSFDYFLFEQRPTIVHRATDVVWEWSGTEWRKCEHKNAVRSIYQHGQKLDREVFVRNFPFVVEKLLDVTP